MNEEISNSDKISAFWSAIAQAQSKLTSVPKSGVNPHFRSSYATLDDILKVALPVFGSAGIGITQWNTTTERGVKVRTVIGHKAGASLSDEFELPCDTSKPQAVGSALTYARRYSLQSVLGIAGEEDDDGNVAQGQSKPVATQTKPRGQARKVPGTKSEFNLDNL
tara:strand:- start:141 stop:635 length:495 start_codon:yes stop_codon:yes gene_type:complete